jgi:hypothetical protein
MICGVPVSAIAVLGCAGGCNCFCPDHSAHNADGEVDERTAEPTAVHGLQLMVLQRAQFQLSIHVRIRAHSHVLSLPSAIAP